VIPFIRAAEKPLALYCFTADAAVGERVLRSTSSGGAIINDVVVHLANPQLPFGGVGASGMGCYHGDASFNCFTHRKSVVKRVTQCDVPLRYPPFTRQNQRLMLPVFTPLLNYYYAVLARVVTDKKNVALAGMGWVVLGRVFKVKAAGVRLALLCAAAAGAAPLERVLQRVARSHMGLRALLE
jgi:hypothetical protein